MKKKFDIHHFYDKTYKKLFSYPKMVMDFLNGFVKEPFIKEIEIIEKVDTEFHTKGFKEFRSDLFFSAQNSPWEFLSAVLPHIPKKTLI